MLKKLFQSPVLKKVITGVTGLALTGFVLAHMTGNLALLASDQAYNEYAEFLTGLGALFYLIEAVLLAFFLFHIVAGINIWLGKRKARPVGYDRYQSAGKPSYQSASSRSMIVTGLILLGFLVLHLASFKFGPGGPGNASEAYLVAYDGAEPIRDLAKLVRERFASPGYAFGYTAVMLLLMVHLRHGVWSALQSIGAMRPSISAPLYVAGGVLGAAIGLGFLFVPLGVYFNLI
ncbi:MAG: succinate dehydrogenase cytochrome b subunit [Rhodothermales bacterium]|nr:succinate dehydrogenase cytochrome b subunit [Rhodothermales bacterium]MBO6779525.1 succinate dehydrogenase cytochrome b subunit [Rhodothermales bacterium]